MTTKVEPRTNLDVYVGKDTDDLYLAKRVARLLYEDASEAIGDDFTSYVLLSERPVIEVVEMFVHVSRL